MDDEEMPFAAPFRRGRPGPFERAHAWATRGRHVRLKEAAFFMVPGALVALLAWELNVHAWLRDPLALLLGFCGVLYGGFGLLPPVRREAPPAPNPKSRRGQR